MRGTPPSCGRGHKSHELIGYDPETGAFASHVYSNLSPTPLPYGWELRDNKLRISVSHGPLDATFEGTISDDGSTFSGGRHKQAVTFLRRGVSFRYEPKTRRQ